jgi:hypothetical protein
VLGESVTSDHLMDLAHYREQLLLDQMW